MWDWNVWNVSKGLMRSVLEYLTNQIRPPSRQGRGLAAVSEMHDPTLSFCLSTRSLHSQLYCSPVPATSEEVHPAQETQLGRGVGVGERLLRQRVQLWLLWLRGLLLRVSTEVLILLLTSIPSVATVLTEITRTRSISELWRTRLEPRPWEPSLRSGRLRSGRTGGTSTSWTRTVYRWRQPQNWRTGNLTDYLSLRAPSHFLPSGLRISRWSLRPRRFYRIRESFKWRDSRWGSGECINILN